jgi:hypothetical protein
MQKRECPKLMVKKQSKFSETIYLPQQSKKKRPQKDRILKKTEICKITPI